MYENTPMLKIKEKIIVMTFLEYENSNIHVWLKNLNTVTKKSKDDLESDRTFLYRSNTLGAMTWLVLN